MNIFPSLGADFLFACDSDSGITYSTPTIEAEITSHAAGGEVLEVMKNHYLFGQRQKITCQSHEHIIVIPPPSPYKIGQQRKMPTFHPTKFISILHYLDAVFGPR